jgi:beta-glucosidase
LIIQYELNFSRQKLWPRLYETYGEDVKLAKDMGRAFVEAMQGDNLTTHENVGVCLKHYVGYGLPLSGQDRTPAWIDDRHMLEYFLPPFEESVRAGAVSLMIDSGEVNGIPGCANYHLLTEVLKQTYQFEGFTVSDWVNLYEYGNSF